MKYAVIGTGKTGKAILDLLPEKDVVAIFNSRNPVDADMLAKADVGIVFVPGKAFAGMLPLLLKSKTPLVIGTTGYEWPVDLDATLRSRNVCWMIGQNFSLGLNVMRYFSERIKEALNALRPNPAKLGIVEKHHIHKLDAPSGTALYIAQALDFPPAEIESVREGDVKGTHTVSFGWPHDRILVTHEALDRAAFAEGVLLACDKVVQLPPGLAFFEDMADEMMTKSVKG